MIIIRCITVSASTPVYNYLDMYVAMAIILFVGSCLATKVFIVNLLAMGRGWIIIK